MLKLQLVSWKFPGILSFAFSRNAEADSVGT